MARVKAEASIFEAASEGIQPAVVVAVIDLGDHLKKKFGDEPEEEGKPPKWQPKVLFVFELAERKSDGSPFLVYKEFTLALGSKAALPKLFKACGMPVPQPGDGEQIVQEVFAGKRLSLNLIHKHYKDKAGQDRTSADIESFLPQDKRDTPFEPLTAPVYWELGDDMPEGLFEDLPRIFGKRIEDVIAASRQFQNQQKQEPVPF